MTPALTPALALGYLRELSADVRDGVVLGADGGLLAGEPALAGPARELVAAMGTAAEAEGRTPAGVALAARGAGGLVLVLACGPRALGGLGRHDLRAVLGDLGAGAPPPAAAPAAVPARVAERLFSAAQRGPGA